VFTGADSHRAPVEIAARLLILGHALNPVQTFLRFLMCGWAPEDVLEGGSGTGEISSMHVALSPVE